MRPFLCRGKTKDNNDIIPDGVWVFGFYMQDLFNGELKDVIFNCPMGFKIDSDTLGQFSGLYDDTSWNELTPDGQKSFLNDPYPEYELNITSDDWKGKMIFDNDILFVPEHYEGDILVEEHYMTVIYDPDEASYGITSADISNYHIKKVGNVHDNPELIIKKLFKNI
jgi:hypothetical protein